MNITGTKSRLKIWGKPKEEVRLKSSCLVSVSAPMEPPSTCFGTRGKGETLIARRSKHTSLSRNFRYSPFKKNLFRFRSHAPFPEKLFFACVAGVFVCADGGRVEALIIFGSIPGCSRHGWGCCWPRRKRKKATCRNCQWQHTLTLRKCTRRKKIINSRSEIAGRQTFPTNFLCLKSGLFS